MKQRIVVGPIKIYVAERKDWIIKPPKKVESEFKKKHRRGVVICKMGKTNEEKENQEKDLVKAIKEITDLILSKKKN